jgi:hypothetical protein
MIMLGILFVAIGLFLAVFNAAVAKRVSTGRYHIDNFFYSITRQNVAVVGAAFVFGGFLFMYLT